MLQVNQALAQQLNLSYKGGQSLSQSEVDCETETDPLMFFGKCLNDLRMGI